MPDRFLSYLQQERQRLDGELQRAQSLGLSSTEIVRLNQLRSVVDDQIACWSAELGSDRLAA